nr:recombinase family protein [Ktedonobacterales bacterium]
MTRARSNVANRHAPGPCRVAAYLRVSTDEQAESGLGLGDQQRRCVAQAVAKGWPAPVIYRDAGVSGTREATKRPALARLLEAARRGELDAIIVLSLDRLGRKTRLVLDLVEQLGAHGVALVSCKEQLDTATPQGQFVLTMFAALAQLERDLISERTIGALAELSRRDGETGGAVPYGYRRATTHDGRIKTVLIDSVAAAVVVRIYALHRRGESTRQIAARLQADAVPPPRRATRWHHTSVASVLS